MKKRPAITEEGWQNSVGRDSCSLLLSTYCNETSALDNLQKAIQEKICLLLYSLPSPFLSPPPLSRHPSPSPPHATPTWDSVEPSSGASLATNTPSLSPPSPSPPPPPPFPRFEVVVAVIGGGGAKAPMRGSEDASRRFLSWSGTKGHSAFPARRKAVSADVLACD